MTIYCALCSIQFQTEVPALTLVNDISVCPDHFACSDQFEAEASAEQNA